MNMIATTEVHNCKQVFECLRCGHQETRRIEEGGKPLENRIWRVGKAVG
jgi:hypothetical protein